MDNCVDYSSHFPGAIAAQGNDHNVLILHKLDSLYRRYDGKKAGFELEYRWLSRSCQDEGDEAFIFVQGSELTYWQRKEIDLAAVQAGRKTLFDLFNLF